MYPSQTYVVRPATQADEHMLRILAQLDSQRPLAGPALIGEVGGNPVAAVSMDDGRVVADPFQRTAALTELLQRRRRARLAGAQQRSFTKRLRAALAGSRTRTATA
jgi:hypothetical protein